MRKNLISKVVSISMFAMMISFAISPATRVYAAGTQSVAGVVAEEKTEEMADDITEDMSGKEFEDMFEGLSDEEAITKLLELTDEALKETYGENNYKLTHEDGIVYIDCWYDGLRLVVDEAKKDDTYKPSWDMVVETMRDASGAFASQYNKHGVNVSLSVLDDTDHDYILISTFNDKVYYDEYVGEADPSALE